MRCACASTFPEGELQTWFTAVKLAPTVPLPSTAVERLAGLVVACSKARCGADSMTDFVLVHGAWHGAWCWRKILPSLWAAGHRDKDRTDPNPAESVGSAQRSELLKLHVTNSVQLQVKA